MKIEELLNHWQRIRAGLLDTIDKFSQKDLDFQPYPGGYTVREIILHIAREEYGEVQFGMTRKISSFPPAYNAEDYPTNISLKGLLSSVHEQTQEYLAGLSDEDLESDIEAGWGGQFLLGDMLWHVLEHEIHHRGELSLILGLLGKEGLNA